MISWDLFLKTPKMRPQMRGRPQNQALGFCLSTKGRLYSQATWQLCAQYLLGRISLESFHSNKRTSPRNMRRSGVGRGLQGREWACLSRTPHGLTPKESYWPGNARGFRMLAHLTTRREENARGSSFLLSQQGKEHFPRWPPALSPRCVPYLFL